jgi:hypothetical protein
VRTSNPTRLIILQWSPSTVRTRVRHTLRRQLYGRKVPCKSCLNSHRRKITDSILKINSSNFPIMTWRSTSLTIWWWWWWWCTLVPTVHGGRADTRCALHIYSAAEEIPCYSWGKITVTTKATCCESLQFISRYHRYELATIILYTFLGFPHPSYMFSPS